jgi:sterol desaturase/sphingolipid hydroxylase (fatty acid hydroxylase superfamily)
VELTEAAIPIYLGGMGAEYRWLRRHAAERGPTPADYERRDTITSLAMGVGSLVAPLVMPRLLRPITPGTGRYAKALIAGAVGVAALTTVADRLARLDPEPAAPTFDGNGDQPGPAGRAVRRRVSRLARRVARTGGVASVVAGGLAITSGWASRTAADRMRRHQLVGDLGTGPMAVALAVFAWDFIYYWNHRLMHESRFLWAIHVVHHSSEHYNLSTALRQPVADAFGTFLPYSVLTLAGVRPELISTARGVNLLYQYWIHTDTIRRIGPFETVLNTPSHHRVHHGSNHQYLDRNHGSILIVWDRLFGTFEPEGAPVIYGLTKNINTFNPIRVATHEHTSMLRDVADSRSWRERLSHVLRGPGWSDARQRPLPPRRKPVLAATAAPAPSGD